MSEVIRMFDGERPAKKQKLLIQNTEKTARIFILNIDCFEEILEYLSAPHLLALSQTCRLMQQVVGDYVKANYSAASKIDENDSPRVFLNNEIGNFEKSGFNHFIRHISFCIQPFKLRGHEFTSLNHLNLIRVDLNSNNIKCIQSLLKKLEIIQIKYCRFRCDFYDSFLRFCTQLKRLYITSYFEDIIKSADNKWLQKTYPTLEHLEIYPKQRLRFNLKELIDFFEINPNVRSFSCSYRFLWEHQVEFIESRIQLDLFEVKIFREFGNERFIVDHMEVMFGILNQLYDRGFYTRLHLHLPNITAECTDQMLTLQGLEKLSIGTFNQWFNLHHLIQLKELAIIHAPPLVKMDALAHELVNLEQLFICHGSYGDVLPFIRFCPKLDRIILKDEKQTDGQLLNISMLNEERQKLKKACRLTIFVSDDLFVKTKWATNGQTYWKFIRIKRSDSYRWKHFYY